ncbi:hypothetical protein GpartN1_g3884.t1 [Galdieria partita]|uniref:High light inducible protein n=1 Tax=Galdieria partita TaxID=83374 RepID=A0A9C7PWI6_9RHOD|nr:hypothetical protein GpartN1_g3884.t1 [Galdieria partita]
MFILGCIEKSRTCVVVRIKKVNQHRYNCFPICMKKSSNEFQKIFGFTDHAETCNGRLAMVGMFVAAIREKVTDKGIFEQLGWVDRQEQCGLFGTLLVIFVLLVTTQYLWKQNKS